MAIRASPAFSNRRFSCSSMRWLFNSSSTSRKQRRVAESFGLKSNGLALVEALGTLAAVRLATTSKPLRLQLYLEMLIMTQGRPTPKGLITAQAAVCCLATWAGVPSLALFSTSCRTLLLRPPPARTRCREAFAVLKPANCWWAWEGAVHWQYDQTSSCNASVSSTVESGQCRTITDPQRTNICCEGAEYKP